MLVEMTLLAAFIGGICLLIWNINFYPSTRFKTSAQISDKPLSGKVSANPKDEDWQEGRTLFKSYCASCHNTTDNSIGPVLAGTAKRWETAGSFKGKTGDQWLKVWVKNWRDVVAAGYPYGVQMAKSREAEMNIFTNLTDKQINMILQYADAPKQVISSY
jgi:mono/diheme cytochrome c family protein